MIDPESIHNKGDGSLPSPGELQREIQEFLRQKYGSEEVHAEVDVLGSKETGGDPDEKETEIDFSMTPLELERHLRKYVVRQERAIEVLATKVATHFNRMRWENQEGANHPRIPGQIKPNILMMGPTGVGKTYIVKLIADKLGVPFVKGDATKFSETGYVGGDVEDLVRDLVRVAGDNIKAAEYGIIYIDEIDKIAASQGAHGPDVSRTGVQRNLLKLMEETEVELRVPHDLASQMEAVIETQKTGKAPHKKVNTRNILFIVSGAFSGLEKIVLKRLNRQPIGFGGDVEVQSRHVDELLEEANTEDLVEYGFESEFIGRLPIMVQLQDLDEEGLYQVLTNPFNAVVQGKLRDFAAYGIELEFTDQALRTLASQAHKEKTGARGLTRVTERALMPFEKQLPSTPISHFKLTREAVADPGAVCRELVFGETVKIAVKSFKEEHGINLQLSPAARRWLTENMEDGKTPGEMLLEKLEAYSDAFNLIEQDSLQITASLLKDPKKYLESLIKRSYSGEEKRRDEQE